MKSRLFRDWNSWLAEMGINFRTTYLLPFCYLLSIVPTMNNSWSKIRSVMHQGLAIAGQQHLLLIFLSTPQSCIALILAYDLLTWTEKQDWKWISVMTASFKVSYKTLCFSFWIASKTTSISKSSFQEFTEL